MASIPWRSHDRCVSHNYLSNVNCFTGMFIEPVTESLEMLNLWCLLAGIHLEIMTTFDLKMNPIGHFFRI